MFNVLTLTKAIEKIGKAMPDINTVILSDIYELNSRPDVNYSVFAITQEQHRADDNYFYFNFVLYYIDRLLNDGSNRLEIQSHGIQILQTIINKLDELGLIINSETDRTFQPFFQRFSDECSGVFARIEVQVPIDCAVPYDILVDPLLADITVALPGEYLPKDYGVDAFKTVTVQGEYPDIWVKKTPTLLVGTQDNPVDYNDLTDSGYYYVNANSSYVVNSPFRGWQPNTVVNVITHIDYDESGTAYNHIVQVATPTYTYTTKNLDYTWGSQYYRVCGWNITIGGMVWGAWQEIATTDNVIRKEAIYISWNEGDEDIDFNNFTTSGYYSLKYIYNHCVNAPVPSFGDCLLNVICDHGNFSGDDDIITQEATFTERNIPPTKYIRTYGKNGGVSGWSAWYQYALTPVNQQ